MLEMHKVLAQIPSEGLVLEFGVSGGNSLRVIAHTVAPRLVYGFDWFKGLPEDWSTSSGEVHVGKGAFAAEIPDVPANAVLVLGLFQDTLDDFLRVHPEPIAFVHFDADLYSSTKYVLDRIGNRLLDGAIFVFDEFSQFQAHLEHEARAFSEFLDSGLHKAEKIEYIRPTAAAFRLTNG